LSAYNSENDTNGLLSRNPEGDLATPFPITTTGAAQSDFFASDFFGSLADFRPIAENEVDIYIGKLEHAFANGTTAKLIVSHVDAESTFAQDSDGVVQSVSSPAPFLENFSTRQNETDQNTAELQFSGDRGSLEWIAGIYYFKEEALEQSSNALVLALPAVSPPSPPPFAPGQVDLTALIDVDVENESQSIYGSLSWNANERLKIRIGGRYTEDSKGYVGRTTIGADGTCIYGPISPCIFLPSDIESENFTWDTSIDFQVNDGVFLYGKVGTGYRTGGISLNARDLDSARGFREDEVLSYELGIKADIGETAHFNAAIFNVDYEDVQQNILATEAFAIGCIENQPTAAFLLTCNLGDATTQGVEFGYVDVDFDGIGGLEFSPVFTPEWSYAVSAIFDMQLAGRDVSTVINYSSSDDWLASSLPNAAELATVESPDLVSFRSTLALSEDLSVSIWGRNLTDEEYFSSRFFAQLLPLGVLQSGSVGEPRTYGISLNYQF